MSTPGCFDWTYRLGCKAGDPSVAPITTLNRLGPSSGGELRYYIGVISGAVAGHYAQQPKSVSARLDVPSYTTMLLTPLR